MPFPSHCSLFFELMTSLKASMLSWALPINAFMGAAYGLPAGFTVEQLYGSAFGEHSVHCFQFLCLLNLLQA